MKQYYFFPPCAHSLAARRGRKIRIGLVGETSAHAGVGAQAQWRGLTEGLDIAIPALPASDWPLVRIYPHFLHLIGPWVLRPDRDPSQEGGGPGVALRQKHSGCRRARGKRWVYPASPPAIGSDA
eukprot:6179547-Pyramimonas_sp.AAC.1